MLSYQHMFCAAPFHIEVGLNSNFSELHIEWISLFVISHIMPMQIRALIRWWNEVFNYDGILNYILIWLHFSHRIIRMIFFLIPFKMNIQFGNNSWYCQRKIVLCHFRLKYFQCKYHSIRFNNQHTNKHMLTCSQIKTFLSTECSHQDNIRMCST